MGRSAQEKAIAMSDSSWDIVDEKYKVSHLKWPSWISTCFNSWEFLKAYLKYWELLISNAHPTVNEALPSRIISWTVLLRGDIERFERSDFPGRDRGYSGESGDLGRRLPDGVFVFGPTNHSVLGEQTESTLQDTICARTAVHARFHRNNSD